jgi:predicted permease
LFQHLRAFFRNVFYRGHVEHELEEEINSYIELVAAEKARGGVAREEALRQAREELGSLERVKEGVRDIRIGAFVDTSIQDVRYALRTLKRNPAFAFAAVASLALGIGANTAMFTLLNAVLLKTLPVHNADRLVQIEQIYQGRGLNFFSWPAIERLREADHSLQDVIAWASPSMKVSPSMNVDFGSGPEPIPCVFVTGNYYPALGVAAAIGRPLRPEDDIPGAPAVAVLGYGAWRSRFGGDANVLGRSLKIEGVPVTIVGVLPAWFFGTEVGRSPEIAIPLSLQPQLMRDRPMLNRPDANWLHVMAWLRNGVTESQAAAELRIIWPRITYSLEPSAKQGSTQFGIRLTSASTGLSQLREQFSRPLFVLMGLVALVLLIACANVANLLLARATARSKEIAMRLAMGAKRARLIRQLLTESLFLAAISGILGTVFAFWGVSILIQLLSSGRNTIVLNLRPDTHVLLFTVSIALITGVLFGLTPALQATNMDVDLTLRAAGRTRGRSSPKLNRALVILQVAVCVILLAGAGLFTGTFYKLLAINLGFNAENVVLVSLNPARAGYRGESLSRFYQQLLDRIDALPGVQAASLSLYPPLTGGGGTFFSAKTVAADGRLTENVSGNVYLNIVGPGFFKTLKTPLLAGREFGPRDTGQSSHVVIVSESLARDYFADRNPIGHRIQIASGPSAEIIGVVPDIKYETLAEAPHRVLYEPYTQVTAGAGGVYVEVRSSLRATVLGESVRKQIHALSGEVPAEIGTLKNWIEQFLVQQRAVALLAIAFGIVAFILAAVGLYGVMAYTVARRTGEMGVRMALGAQSAQIQWLIMRETLMLACAGVALGVSSSILMGRFVSSLLFGLTPHDPVVIGSAVALLISEALVAGYLPARRASRVDPMVALRYE